jgi:preprotein translocase subunit SecD
MAKDGLLNLRGWNAMMTRLILAAPIILGLRFLFPQVVSAAEEKTDNFAVYIGERAPSAGLKEAKVEGKNGGVIFLPQTPVVTAVHIADSQAVRDSAGNWAVEVAFNKPGKRKLGTATGENLLKEIAIVVKGKVISTATIRGKVADRIQITGTYSKLEAETLADEILASADETP